VSDEWLTCISSFSSSRSSSLSYPIGVISPSLTGSRQIQTTSNNETIRGIPSSPPLRVVSSFANTTGGTSPMMMDLGEEYDDDFVDSAMMNYHPPFLPSPSLNELHEDDNINNNAMEDCCGGSFGSRSTSSFVSAKEELLPLPLSSSSTPLFPSVLPPPEFFSMNLTPTPTSSLWLYQTRSSAMAPLLPRESSISSPTNEDIAAKSNSLCGRNDEMSCEESYRPATPPPTNGATSTITLIDLRGSQRLSDRGLLQLSHTPLCSLEVARLDNCHGITGRGLLAFSRSFMMHTLSLSNCRRLTDEAVVNVSHLGASLMTLNLGGCRCLTDRSLEAMSGLLELRQLDLSQVSLEECPRYNCNSSFILDLTKDLAFSFGSAISSQTRVSKISPTLTRLRNFLLDGAV
jgi:hypothetical protein